MANDRALDFDDEFAVVDALYQEAELSLPEHERPEHAPDHTPKHIPNIPAKNTRTNATPIRSRKPKSAAQNAPLFTRISDLYEESEAVRLLADEAPKIAPKMATPPQEEIGDGDFAIPASFDMAPAPIEPEPEDITEEDIAEDIADSPIAQNASEEDTAPPLTDDELADLVISEEFSPAIALDDALDALAAPANDQTDVSPNDQADIQTDIQTGIPADVSGTPSSEADALAALDAARPEADDALAQQLAEVKSAVEGAQAAHHSQDASAEEPEELTEGQPEYQPEESQQEQADLSSLTAGPALASFIGETVKDVLDAELPNMVRGLVDEALGERQGRYGRSDTPHIGLRTKPSRH